MYALEDDERVYFYTNTAASVAGGQTQTVTVTQGTQLVDQPVALSNGSAVSNGAAGQRFNIRESGVVPSSIVVDVYEGVGGTAVRWTYDPNLSASGVSDSTYSVYVSADGYSQIVFGNGVNGRIPPTNTEIKASYTVSAGSGGNVAAGTIVNMVEQIPFITLNGNANAAFGGIDSESIASIKNTLPSVFRSQNRAVSLSDYEDLARGVSGVSKAKAVYNGSGANGGSVTVHVVPYQTNYTVSSSTAASLAVDLSLRTSVANELSAVSLLGITAIAVPNQVITQRVRITMTVYVKSNYVARVVKDNVTAAVQNLLSFDNVSFGGRLTIGEVYRSAMGVDGVDYVTIEEFNLLNSNALQTSVTADATKLLQIGSFAITATGGVVPPAS
jgi:predicted phage baseplate assembly protein